MIVSHSHRFIFVHVSKAAGTSIERALEPFRHRPPDTRLNRWRCKLGLQWDYRRYRFRQHDSARLARRVLPAALFDDYFKFGFVRNPWDWLASLYSYLQRTPGHRHHRRVRAMSFAEYVTFEIQRGQRTQSDFLIDENGRLLVDFVGRFENLEADFARVCQRLGLGPIPLPHRNASRQRRPYQSLYDATTRDRVARHWAGDVRRFGYRFEEPTP